MSRRDPHVFAPRAQEDGAKLFWKSLEEKERPELAQERALVETAAVAAAADAKLVKLRRGKNGAAPAVTSNETDASIGRRGFMLFAGASAALAAEGCARRPVEKILPYSKAPEHVLPGVPSHYASVRQFRSDAIGIVVESHEGRPTKVDGNPKHPSTGGRGGSDLWTQAAVYELYDPDRSATPMRGGRVPATQGVTSHQPATWQEIDAAIADIARAAQLDGGAKLRILVEPTNSPTFIRIRDALQAKLPQVKVHTWASVNEANAREGARIAFGQPVTALPDYARASVIVSLDCDFLGTEPGNVRANHGFAQGRKLEKGPDSPMNRLYVVEPTYTITGMNADHRLRLAAQDVERYLLALAKELTDKHAIDVGGVGKADAAIPGVDAKWIQVVAKELAGARAKSILVAGTRQPARVHALVHTLNAALGNAGHTINFYPPADRFETDPAASLKALVDDMASTKVGTLVILGGNPVYDAPADLKFGERLRALGSTVHFSSHMNETSEACMWHAPRAHELECWGDQTSLDGTVAIQQPLIAPLFGGRSDIEVLAKLAGDISPKGYDLVQQTVRGSLSSAGQMNRVWNEALKTGVLGPSAKTYGAMDARKTEVAAAFAAPPAKPATTLGPDNLEITFAPCPKLFDGRFANNPLLLELPDPVNKISWDNVATVSKATAQALGVENGTLVRLTRAGAPGPVEIAMWITPGQADNSIGLTLGWGRQKAGRYGNKHGFDVSGLRTTDAMGTASGVKVAKLSGGEVDAIKDRFRKVGMAAAESPVAGRIRPDDPIDVETGHYKISQTQEHESMEGRPLAIDATLAEYKKQPFFPFFPDEDRKDVDLHGKVIGVRESGSPDPEVLPLWKKVDYSKVHKWGMGIDLSSCTGCNACVVACQVENNVPTVGKEQVWRGREMYWLRIDRYFVGLDHNNPEIAFQPVACVHCEEAPCENVCPVNATEHSPEGLNDMAYNRCIGTRYCANNCPYKVRRFNFLNYHTSGGSYDDVPETEKMRYNPNVTVRMRGVMEKCTYCVQRIQEGKISSKRTGKPIKDGEVVSACSQACPADAIVFGDLNDPESRVAKWRQKDRSYRLLSELGTHPRTSYLGKIRNPNPEMGAA
ncbi:MAG: Molybdopterin oxidoreductase, iron-sulfur binding subunit [Labilithrix sp.]|nr:Molybdopterin oxidoreductase, iron-sulfur binding subunit [Labilithrix sp.]